MNRSDLIALAREAVTDPRRNGARIAAIPLRGSLLWESVLLVSALSVIGIWLVALISFGDRPAGEYLPAPLVLLGMQVVAMLALALAVALLGRLAKGQGDFDGALRIVTWLQGLMVVVQFVQIILMIILPPLAGFVSLAALLGAAWIATGLIAGLHGFRSLPLTFLGMIGGVFVVAFAMSFVFATFGALLN